jgi:4a-hydroxytetrahydrobiopterin dehydratase
MDKTKLKMAMAKLAKDGWTVHGVAIRKKYVFKNFEDAFAFMTRCALEIEKLDHHPEWFNVYNKITVDLSTHSAGGVTEKDLGLARIMDSIAACFPIAG